MRLFSISGSDVKPAKKMPAESAAPCGVAMASARPLFFSSDDASAASETGGGGGPSASEKTPVAAACASPSASAVSTTPVEPVPSR